MVVLISEVVYVLLHDKGRHQGAPQKEQQGLKSHLFQQGCTLVRDKTLPVPNQGQK